MAVSARDSKLLEQKDLISQLNTTIAAQTELIQSLKVATKGVYIMNTRSFLYTLKSKRD